MRIGTTPTHEFILPFGAELVSGVEITYCQNKKIVLRKGENDCEIAGNVVSLTLSQEDTFKFIGDVNVEIMIRVVDVNGKVYASDIMKLKCQRCLSNEVIG